MISSSKVWQVERMSELPTRTDLGIRHEFYMAHGTVCQFKQKNFRREYY